MQTAAISPNDYPLAEIVVAKIVGRSASYLPVPGEGMTSGALKELNYLHAAAEC